MAEGCRQELGTDITLMKKAELHVHLEGSIEPETLIAIDPSLTREEIDANLTCGTFAEFLQGYIWVTKKLKSPSITPSPRAIYSIRWPPRT